jgi:hypothetical protein
MPPRLVLRFAGPGFGHDLCEYLPTPLGYVFRMRAHTREGKRCAPSFRRRTSNMHAMVSRRRPRDCRVLGARQGFGTHRAEPECERKARDGNHRSRRLYMSGTTTVLTNSDLHAHNTFDQRKRSDSPAQRLAIDGSAAHLSKSPPPPSPSWS